MMMGLPASGKSTIAKTLADSTPDTVIHSSDKLREELLGDVSDQSANARIFEELHRRIKLDLSDGLNVVYDATNLSKRRRSAFLAELKHIPCEKCLVCVLVPYEKCLERNEQRFDRQVPEYVIERMYKNFEPPDYAEGFDLIALNYNFDIRDSFRKYDISKLFKKDSWFMTFDQENKHHTLPLGAHCDAAASYITGVIQDRADKDANIDELTRLGMVEDAAWLHDIGKPFTKSRLNGKGEDDGQCHYYQHHCVGAYDCFFYLRNATSHCDLDTPAVNNRHLYISNLIYWHMAPYTAWKQSDKSRERDRKLMSEEMYNDVLLLHKADIAAH